MKPRILIVDDEKNTREGLRWALEGHNFEISLAADGKQAIEILSVTPVDLVITDLKMPQIDGLDLMKHIQRHYPETLVIILTGHGTIDSAVGAMKNGAFDFIEKPVNIDDLNNRVERAFLQKNLKEENEEMRRTLQEQFGLQNIIGKSAAMREVFDKIIHVAPSRATVLIQGESGTGKELIASAIHYNSRRKGKPFIKLNCGALTPTLLESELFGHEKGAFTDAHRQKVGRFEMADDGTLFLDEISETTPEFQVKLLRVLQEQEFERVGGTKTIRVDVRVLAATNKNLRDCVEKGTFREDLFYRLNVIQITVPPLRDRPEDIPLLVDAFVKEFCRENGRPALKIPAPILNILERYPWPGNVRQLRNIIEGMVVMAVGEELTPDSLPEEIRLASERQTHIRIPAGASLAEAEKALIEATLTATEGNRAKTARILGIGRKTLYRKMGEYGLEAGEE
ncbi:MAG TPA: sigma-54 dependent transcriptional regulator [Candidatus Sumerlaeota bacterium]|nr:sigma-54 dependent transcriptional regulator [Candidatus Sumerlaeota bacterium]